MAEKIKTSDYPVSSHQELGQLLATFDSLNMDLEVPRSGQNSALVYRDQRAADETIADAERDEYLRGLIAGLTEEERQILYQHYYCGRRFCEMSFEGKKRSRSWVCRKHTQALAHLRASIERDSSNEEGLV